MGDDDRFWLVLGFESNETKYERRVPVSSMSEDEMCVTLQRLASRHLTEDEVVGASLPPQAEGQNSLLSVSRGAGLSAGHNPYYTAIVMTREQLRAREGS